MNDEELTPRDVYELYKEVYEQTNCIIRDDDFAYIQEICEKFKFDLTSMQKEKIGKYLKENYEEEIEDFCEVMNNKGEY